MRVIVSIDHRFLQAPNGQIYSTGGCGYAFWKRYLQVFDEVVVFARVKPVEAVSGKLLAEGEGVRFIQAPHFLGPWQYFQQYVKLKSVTKQVSRLEGAFILRCPGAVSTVLWKELCKQGIPFGVEVVGDPWDSFSPGSVVSVVRPWVRRMSRADLLRQCRQACVASYVTEYMLQKAYPPGGWSTHYSSIDLSPEAVVADTVPAQRRRRLVEKQQSGQPIDIGYVGTLAQLYKGPDTLLEAFHMSLQNGLQARLHVIGDGQYREMLTNRARQMGLDAQVCFYGKLPSGPTIYEKLDEMDLYVLPSRQEGLPRTVIEAMARATPVLSTTIGGIPELLSADDLVVPNDPKGLSAKMLQVIRDPARVERMSQRNLHKAVGYTCDKLNQRRVELYKRLIKVTENG